MGEMSGQPLPCTGFRNFDFGFEIQWAVVGKAWNAKSTAWLLANEAWRVMISAIVDWVCPKQIDLRDD